MTVHYGGVANYWSSTSAGVTQTVRPTTVTDANPSGNGMITVTLGGGGNACGFTNWSFQEPTNPPVGHTFPYGLFSFVAATCTQRGTVTLTFLYPTTRPNNTQFWKHGPTVEEPTPHWYSLPATISGQPLTVHLTDGGVGDSDLTANSAVTDRAVRPSTSRQSPP